MGVASLKKNPAKQLNISWREQNTTSINFMLSFLSGVYSGRSEMMMKRILNLNFPECRYSLAARFLKHLVVRARQRRCTRM